MAVGPGSVRSVVSSRIAWSLYSASSVRQLYDCRSPGPDHGDHGPMTRHVLALRPAHQDPDARLPDQRAGVAARRPDDREPHPPEQLRRPADRPRPAHRLHARRPLPRTDPPAQGSGPRLLARRHVQPRRILPDAAGRPAQLPPLDARDVLRPRQHPAGRTSTSPTAPSPPTRSRTTAPRYEQQIRRAGGIDLQILGIGRTGHIGFNEPGSTRAQPHAAGHARPGHAPRRRQRLLRRGERAAPGAHDGRRHHPRGPQDRPAWRSASTRPPIVQQGRRGRDRPTPSPPASCSSTPTPRSCSTRPAAGELTAGHAARGWSARSTGRRT